MNFNPHFLASDLQSEVETIAASLLYMESAKEDVRSDISIIKRAAEKADTEVSNAQADKKRQVSNVCGRFSFPQPESILHQTN